MARGRFILIGLAVLLINSAANAQTQPVIPAPGSNPDAFPPSPDPKPKHELDLLVPDGFGGLKQDPPMSSQIPDGMTLPPNLPTVDPNSIAPDR
jgi:hypothetical protein